MIDIFFNTLINAIQKEEHELNDLFIRNKDLYKKHHQGVCNLYETTFVYLFFKELLRQKFPFTVYWEYPYPFNSNLHSDLAILDKDGKLEALVEFKIWMEDHDKKIKLDISKLEKVKDIKKFIVIIGYGGDMDENDRFLQKNKQLSCVKKQGLTTKFYKKNLDLLEDNELNIFLYEVI